jgi:hypothetical protein
MRKRGIAVLLAILLLGMGATGLDDLVAPQVNDSNTMVIGPHANNTVDDNQNASYMEPAGSENTTPAGSIAGTIEGNATVDGGDSAPLSPPTEDPELEPFSETPPLVMCAWTQDSTALMEDGDPDHLTPGGQFFPPCVYGGVKRVEYWMVVAVDPAAAEEPAVSAQLTLPNGTPRQTIMLNESPETGVSAVMAASDAQLLSWGNDTNGAAFSFEDVENRLGASEASIWHGVIELEYYRDAGEYALAAGVTVGNETASTGSVTKITFLPAACCEYDFSVIDYGSVVLNTFASIPGDADFGTGDKPTVRNTGNLPLRVTIQQDAMGFSQDDAGLWPIEYGAMLGSNGSEVRYSPFETVILPDLLPVLSSQELTFSVRVTTGSGQGAGSLVLGCELSDE